MLIELYSAVYIGVRRVSNLPTMFYQKTFMRISIFVSCIRLYYIYLSALNKLATKFVLCYGSWETMWHYVVFFFFCLTDVLFLGLMPIPILGSKQYRCQYIGRYTHLFFYLIHQCGCQTIVTTIGDVGRIFYSWISNIYRLNWPGQQTLVEILYSILFCNVFIKTATYKLILSYLW